METKKIIDIFLYVTCIWCFTSYPCSFISFVCLIEPNITYLYICLYTSSMYLLFDVSFLKFFRGSIAGYFCL